ncbi:MAG: hypothetical protein V4594_03620 [Bacteroidota bacterium]
MFKSMKTGVVAAILIGTALIAQAQKKITEGTLTYGIEYNLTDDQKGYEAMLPKQTAIKFKDNLSKIEMDQGPALIKIISDKNTKTGLLLVDIPIAQKQYAAKMSKEDFDAFKGNAPKFSDFKATGEKQKVGTYDAEKYTYKDENGGAYELWATNDVILPEGYKDDEFKDVKGTLVKFTVIQNGVKSTLTLKGIKEEKVGVLSIDVPKGYELKTMAELKAMQGGGQ